VVLPLVDLPCPPLPEFAVEPSSDDPDDVGEDESDCSVVGDVVDGVVGEDVGVCVDDPSLDPLSESVDSPVDSPVEGDVVEVASPDWPSDCDGD
jgi:hypothetical protein